MQTQPAIHKRCKYNGRYDILRQFVIASWLANTTVAPRDFILSKGGQHKLCSETTFSPKVANESCARDFIPSKGSQHKLSRETSFSPSVAIKRIAVTHHCRHQWPTKLSRDTSLSPSGANKVEPRHIISAISGQSRDTSLSPSMA